jgi:hypothetical protein
MAASLTITHMYALLTCHTLWRLIQTSTAASTTLAAALGIVPLKSSHIAFGLHEPGDQNRLEGEDAPCRALQSDVGAVVFGAAAGLPPAG